MAEGCNKGGGKALGIADEAKGKKPPPPKK
jgi:hypothetical protein